MWVIKYPDGTYMPDTIRLNEHGLYHYEGTLDLHHAHKYRNYNTARRGTVTVEIHLGWKCEIIPYE